MDNEAALRALAEQLFRAKEERRAELARLPFEQKIAIVVELQKIASEIAANVGRPAPKPWDIPPG